MVTVPNCSGPGRARLLRQHLAEAAKMGFSQVLTAASLFLTLLHPWPGLLSLFPACPTAGSSGQGEREQHRASLGRWARTDCSGTDVLTELQTGQALVCETQP